MKAKIDNTPEYDWIYSANPRKINSKKKLNEKETKQFRNKKLQADINLRPNPQCNAALEKEIEQIKNELIEKKKRLAGKNKEQKLENTNTNSYISKSENVKKPLERVHARPKTTEEYSRNRRSQHIPGLFTTEYQSHYKPYIYASFNELDKIKQEDRDRVVLLSKEGNNQICTRNEMVTDIKKKSYFSTTYDETFGKLTRAKSSQNVMRSEIKNTRERADFYRSRQLASHFSRNHLVQVLDDATTLWEPIPAHTDTDFPLVRPKQNMATLPTAGLATNGLNSNRIAKVFSWNDVDDYTPKQEKLTDRMPAGKPSGDDFVYADYPKSNGHCSGTLSDRSSINSSLSLAEKTLRKAKEQQSRLEILRNDSNLRHIE
ncbi:hypothetical protein Ciccas_006222 [Cichlidogyrus casuarinus]|uniref:Nuclear protein MDM1 n=1 Tax=Cichlidogyrus casuarinus TaxID=1844966 RepID=A0ABD2Q7J3_9PLAT